MEIPGIPERRATRRPVTRRPWGWIEWALTGVLLLPYFGTALSWLFYA